MGEEDYRKEAQELALVGVDIGRTPLGVLRVWRDKAKQWDDIQSELAELRKDRERLDFLESDIELYRRKGIVIRLHTKGGLGLSTASSLREALDDLGAVPDTAPPEEE